MLVISVGRSGHPERNTRRGRNDRLLTVETRSARHLVITRSSQSPTDCYLLTIAYRKCYAANIVANWVGSSRVGLCSAALWVRSDVEKWSHSRLVTDVDSVDNKAWSSVSESDLKNPRVHVTSDPSINGVLVFR